MSDKPKIYSNCKAGCLWETVHKEDFMRSAAFIKQTVTDNGTFKEFNLEAGQTCILAGDIATERSGDLYWNVNYEIRDALNNVYNDTVTIARDGWDTYIRVKHCGVYEQLDGTYLLYYEINDEQLTCIVDDPTIVIRLMYVDEVYLVNKDAKIIGEGLSEGDEARIQALEDAVADLLYVAMAISKFTNNVGTAEMGSTVTAATLSWTLNKEAESVTLDGEAQATGTSGSKALTGLSITSNKTWTLKATDERGATATKTTSITFLNGIYYGAGATFDISALTKTLSNTKGRTFTADAGEGEYLWYAVPSRLGTCTFKVGGFDGGFSLSSTESVTNASGYAEEYYIYRSDNASLGSTTVVVS